MNLSKYKKSLKNKGWYFCFLEAWKRIMPIRWVNDLNITNQIFEKRAYHFLKKKYLPMLKQFKPTNANQEDGKAKTIWVCWLQGEEHAPQLVKHCLSSIRRNAGDYEVQLITNNNLESFVDIPPYIKSKLEKRQMQFATYSDYIRIALLEKYGGIWTDATTFFTSGIPKEITSAPLFCFQKSCLSQSPILMSSWFLVADANNRIIQMTKYLFEQYWQRENHLCNYYLFHLLFSLVAEYDQENRQCWQNMPYVSNVYPHVLMSELFDSYDENKFQEACRNSFVHKLSYKFEDQALTEKKGTLYYQLVNSIGGL